MGIISQLQVALSKNDTLKTLSGGLILMICLHFVIKFEQIKEHGDFGSLDILVEDDFQPLGLTTEEIFPSKGPYKIPKRIHQTWKNAEIPSKLIKWIKTWLKNHPDWEYWLWTDASARSLIEKHYPYLLKTFDSYNENIRRADALRYVILYEFGGVYADMDLENLKPLDPMLRKYSCFIGQQPYEHSILDSNFEELLINALMACRPKHPLMKLLMDNLPSFKHMWNVLDSTGPHFLTNIYNKYKEMYKVSSTHINGTYITPAEYFFPTLDPQKYFSFRHRCSKYHQLSSLQQKACKTLKVKGGKRKPSSVSFTEHHWMGTYLDFSLSLKGPVHIVDIVPDVKVYYSDIDNISKYK